MLHVQTVLFPTDDSPAAEAARPLAERFAARHGATLHVLRVDATATGSVAPASAAPRIEADGVVQVRRRFPMPADAILAYAEEIAADLLVMGTHGRTGIDRLTLGSTVESVLRRAPCPVLTVSPRAAGAAVGPVLAPLAFDSASDVSLETAAALAEALGTHGVALHVIEPIDVPVPYMMALPPIDTRDLAEGVEATLDTWVAPLAERVPIETAVHYGDAAQEIVAAAHTLSAGLVVQASHGRRGLSRWLLGSVAEGVVREASCPVLTLRMGARPLLRPDRPSAPAVPREDWPDLFDALSRHAAASPHEVSVDMVSADAVGPVFRAAPFVGMTYDPRADTLDIAVTGAEHHVVRPFAVRSEAGAWAVEGVSDPDAPGPWTFDVVGANGARERVTVRAARTPAVA